MDTGETMKAVPPFPLLFVVLNKSSEFHRHVRDVAYSLLPVLISSDTDQMGK